MVIRESLVEKVALTNSTWMLHFYMFLLFVMVLNDSLGLFEI